MLGSMSSVELSEWMAFFMLEREDHEAARTDAELSRGAAEGLKKRIARQRGR